MICEALVSPAYVSEFNKNKPLTRCTIDAKFKYQNVCYCKVHLGLRLINDLILEHKVEIIMVTKTEAEYKPKTDYNKCEDCKMFRKPSACTLVKGYIEAEGHCKYFERRNKLNVGN